MSFSLARLSRRHQLILLVLVVAIGVAAVHWLSLRFAVPQLAASENRVKVLHKELKAVTRKLETSRAREKVAEQNAEVMRQANQLLRQQETAHQEQLHRLQSELDFYRRLAGTSGSQSGLAVYHLDLKPTGSERVYRYILTLTQNLQRSAITTGNVRIALEGTLEDRPVTLPWARITEAGTPQPSFRFKYFEQIEGYLVIPAAFHPGRLLVTLDAKGQKKPVSRGFNWNRLVSGAGPEEPAPPEEDTPTDAQQQPASADGQQRD